MNLLKQTVNLLLFQFSNIISTKLIIYSLAKASVEIDPFSLTFVLLSLIFYQPGYRSPLNGRKESPDSKGQHTG